VGGLGAEVSGSVADRAAAVVEALMPIAIGDGA